MPAVRNYESFFEQTIIINYTSFVFAICNIYDSSAQALSINRLRRLVPDNPNVKGVNYKDIDARLRKARKIADKLRKVRNTRIAHRLEQMLHENAYDEIKLLYNDLSDLIADTKSAFIDLSFHVDEWVPQFSTEVEDDLERLMDALVNYHGTKLMNAA